MANRGLVRVVIALLTIVGNAGFATLPAATAGSANPTHRGGQRPRAASGCAGANAPARSASPAVLRSAVVCLIDQQRAVHHLPPLHVSALLDRSAQNWTDVMVHTHQFTHGANFASRIGAVGYAWRAAGENIATGYGTPRAVVHAWMASAGHCENILNPAYRDVGTGVNPHPVRGFATGAGTWTQDFALRVNQSPPSRNFAPAHGCPY
ncbi:MAG: CAP domain-containing protein [Solirubrobacterales bacterium]|nr:CAP domain-containing protein [Solirubrobacterales bacterium]MBV9365231.1 CAP domain-containing protein [Solirubrobacterales bacterium]